MSDKKYVVPSGMLGAAIHEFFNARSLNGVSGELGDGERLHYALIAAVRWLSENPVVPTYEQAVNLALSINGETGAERWQLLVSEWQRRMFLAPDSEVPDAVKDLLCPANVDAMTQIEANHCIIEAYNRGKSGK